MSDALDELLTSGEHRLSEAESQALYAVLRRQTGELRNINELMAERLTPGQRAADAVARTVGSWRFIIVQSLFLLAWLAVRPVRRAWSAFRARRSGAPAPRAAAAEDVLL